ncbi:hypothetical protein BGZ51_004631 [Haplosporangium sp. Z 767]|nr:hypothetical protein BGZ51_004631 [Haplosporangium sp. Z 767]KAF9195547.1 hypothetical protein BGZ50_004347 [Haplosporangium sp. Z 11]
MKFTLSIAVLALAASQAMAVVPIPIDKCTKTVIVQPTDIGCEDFAAKNGCTFANLLEWNQKLRQDCLNLDVGHPLCVSITPGAGNSTTAVDPTIPTTPTTSPIVSPVATTINGTPAPAATASVSAPAPSHPGASPVGTPGPAATTSAHGNAGAGTKSSIAVTVAGILISVIYMF